MTTMDKVTQQISIKILAHLVNKNLLQMCFRCKYAFFCTVTYVISCHIKKPASIIFVTKYVTFMLDFRVIYVTHVTYVIIYVTGVTYMICYKYDPTQCRKNNLSVASCTSVVELRIGIFTMACSILLHQNIFRMNVIANVLHTFAQTLTCAYVKDVRC